MIYAKDFDPVMREQGLNAVKLCNTRKELRTLWSIFKDEVVREAAKDKASTLPLDGGEPLEQRT